MADAFTIHSSALPAAAQLAGFHGVEGISRLYRFDVFLVMTNDVGHEVDLRSAVGAKATLRLERTDGRPSFVVNGIFASLELVSDFGGRSFFRAVLVPRFWHLVNTLHSRIFTQQSIPAILGTVLDQGGLAGGYSLQLLGSYATEEHVCQYHESDFDFVSRWMEREGLYYYFEQDEEEERLIITDDRSTHRVLGDRPVRYFPQGEGVLSADRFRAFTCRASSLPATVRFKDYDYAKPTFEVSGQAPVSSSGVGQISVHGARFFSPGDGARLAQVKAQSLLAGEVVYQGSGAAPDLRPGYLFDLEDHPRASFNARYLTTEIEHWANRMPGVPELARLIPWDDAYRVEATAIAADVQYRAPQRTEWPRIYGGEHAVIDGPAPSEYAQIDTHGRYAVKFHFDESALSGGKASTWVRMLQPHGGTIEGFHFPLRVGTEVVCSFSGGDPDRPFIVGVAPNALTPSPVTAGNHTRNVIQTGGRNRVEMEDQAGLERITMSTPHANSYVRMGAPNADHTFHMHTDLHTLLDQGGNLDIQVGQNKTEYVVGTTTETYQGVADIEYKAATTLAYDDTKTETVTGALTETQKSTVTRTIGTSMKETIGSGGGEVLTQQINGDAHVTATGTYKVTALVDHHTTTQGDFWSTTNGSKTDTVNGKSISIVDGSRVSTTQLDSTSHTVGFNFSFVEGASISNVLGGAVSGTEGGAVNAVVGARVNYTLGPQLSFNTGPVSSFLTGISTSIVTGGKFEEITGFKFDVISGPTYKSAPLEMKTVDAVVDFLFTDCSAAEFKFATRAIGVTAADLETLL